MKTNCFIFFVLFAIIMVNCTKRAVVEVAQEKSELLPDTIIVKTQTTVGCNERQEFFDLYKVSIANKNLQDSIFKYVFEHLSTQDSFLSDAGVPDSVVLISKPFYQEYSFMYVAMVYESAQFEIIPSKGNLPYGYFYHNNILFIIDSRLKDIVKIESDKKQTFGMTIADFDMVHYEEFFWTFDYEGNTIDPSSVDPYYDLPDYDWDLD